MELFKVPEGLNISRHCVHMQYKQDFWVLAFKMTIKKYSRHVSATWVAINVQRRILTKVKIHCKDCFLFFFFCVLPQFSVWCVVTHHKTKEQKVSPALETLVHQKMLFWEKQSLQTVWLCSGNCFSFLLRSFQKNLEEKKPQRSLGGEKHFFSSTRKQTQ